VCAAASSGTSDSGHAHHDSAVPHDDSQHNTALLQTATTAAATDADTRQFSYSDRARLSSGGSNTSYHNQQHQHQQHQQQQQQQHYFGREQYHNNQEHMPHYDVSGSTNVRTAASVVSEADDDERELIATDECNLFVGESHIAYCVSVQTCQQ
jgi:hypothetical protein